MPLFNPHRRKEENMDARTPDQKLSQLRLEVIDLLKDWDKHQAYKEKETVFQSYLGYLLINTQGHIHKHKRDVLVDFKVLKDLLTVLKPNIAEGERNFIQFQIAVIYANKRLGMLLQEVDRKLKERIITPDDDFKKWIDVVLVNEDWQGYLKFAHRCEPRVLNKANAKGVHIEQQTMTPEDFDFVNLNDIENHLMMYRKGVEDAHNMPQKNVDCIAHGPGACKFIEEVMSELSYRISVLPDDDIEEETSNGVQTTIEADDDAELAVDGWTGQKKIRMD